MEFEKWVYIDSFLKLGHIWNCEQYILHLVQVLLELYMPNI